MRKPTHESGRHTTWVAVIAAVEGIPNLGFLLHAVLFSPGPDGSSRLIADIERSLPAVETGGFEKLCYFPHVGIGTTGDADFEELARSRPDVVLKAIERWPNLLLGMIQLNANDIRASLDALNSWLRDGPMLGVYFPVTHKRPQDKET